jgi:hypothetical protein
VACTYCLTRRGRVRSWERSRIEKALTTRIMPQRPFCQIVNQNVTQSGRMIEPGASQWMSGGVNRFFVPTVHDVQTTLSAKPSDPRIDELCSTRCCNDLSERNSYKSVSQIVFNIDRKMLTYPGCHRIRACRFEWNESERHFSCRGLQARFRDKLVHGLRQACSPRPVVLKMQRLCAKRWRTFDVTR